jgi:hypothetical protein
MPAGVPGAACKDNASVCVGLILVLSTQRDRRNAAVLLSLSQLAGHVPIRRSPRRDDA